MEDFYEYLYTARIASPPKDLRKEAIEATIELMDVVEQLTWRMIEIAFRVDPKKADKNDIYVRMLIQMFRIRDYLWRMITGYLRVDEACKARNIEWCEIEYLPMYRQVSRYMREPTYYVYLVQYAPWYFVDIVFVKILKRKLLRMLGGTHP